MAEPAAKRTDSAGAYLLVGAVITAAIVLLLTILRQDRLVIAVHQGVEGVALKETAARFAAAENVPVEVIDLPYEELYDSELEQLQADKSKYDVVMADDPWLPAFLDIDGTIGLERVELDRETCLKLEKFVARLLWVSRHPYSQSEPACEDAYYALPFVGNSQLFGYRRDVEQPPKTWPEALDGPGYVMRVGPGNSIVTDFMPMLWSISPDAFPASAEKERMTLPPNALTALENLATLGRRSRANLSILSVDDFDLAIHMARGEASASIVWSAWAMAMTRLPSAYGEQLNEEIDFSDVPGGQPALGAWLLAIPANAPRPDLARRFLLFATDEDQLREAAIGGNPPPLESLLEDPDLAERFKKTFPRQLESLGKARPRPRTKHWRNIERTMGRCLSAVYESAITPQEALDRINAAIASVTAGNEPGRFNCE